MKDHWEQIYREKRPHEVSWWQERPLTSLDLIHSAHVPRTAQIIDIGGGDSTLVDCLLDEGYGNVTVLDVSAQAIERAKARLGKKADGVHWIVSDIRDFTPDRVFDLWHDRAAFHFLTEPESIARYIAIAGGAVRPGGYAILGTFSTAGPKACSGLPVHQYDENSLGREFQKSFEKITCITIDHVTPFNTRQNFLFCSFIRIA